MSAVSVTRADLERLVVLDGCDDGIDIGEALWVNFSGDGVHHAIVEASCTPYTTELPSSLLSYTATPEGPRLLRTLINYNEEPMFGQRRRPPPAALASASDAGGVVVGVMLL